MRSGHLLNSFDPRPPAAADTSMLSSSELDRTRVLENVVFAQRWDIAALTEQRDQSIQAIGLLEDERTLLKQELARLRAGTAAQRADLRLGEHALSARSAVAISVARATADLAADLALGCQPDRQERLTPALVAEVMLLQASGLFDREFYLRQVCEELSLADALCHYVQVGEAAGRSANPLFDRELYSGAARRTDAPGLDRFASYLGHYAAIGAGLGLCPGPLVDPAFCRRQIDPADHPAFEPISYYLQVGRFIGFSPHPLIDKAHYLQVRGGLGVGEDPLADHLLVGAEQGLSLHPLFDAAWYLEANNDVRDAGLDPLRHYLMFGDAEGRWPNPLFDPAYYRANTPVPADMPALTHYVLQGSDQRGGTVAGGARTHPLFDGAWYLARNQDVGVTGIDPLEHYLGSGAHEWRSPHPLFDTKYLLEHHPALLRHHRNPLVAFLRSRAHVSGSPHPLFDPAHYVAQVPEAAAAPDGVFAHFLRCGSDNQADPHPLFCTRFYCEQVAQAAGDDPASDPWAGERNPLAHFIATEVTHAFRPHPLFDPAFYLDTNADVRGHGISPLVHFMASGGTRLERRQPHVLFDITLYAARLAAVPAPDVDDDTNLLLDYLTHWRERPSPHALFDSAHYGSQPLDELRHANPLADYAWKGRAAPRAPHLLFDPTYYAACVDIQASWQRTLLEHYVGKLSPEGFLPHPAIDGEHVAGLIGDPPTSNATLLEYFADPATCQDLSPHPRFGGRDWILLHPGSDSETDPFTGYLRQGGRPGWVLTGHPSRILACYEAEKAALCGIGGIAPVSPHAARARAVRHHLATRAVTKDAYRITGRLPAHRGDSRGRLAIYAAGAEAHALHEHAMAALAQAGFTILFVTAADLTRDADTNDIARSHAAAVLSHRLGNQHIGSWVLACRLFGETIAGYDQVLFLSDNLVGPITPPEKMFESLAACATGWWGACQADQSSGAVDAELFALSGQVIAAAPFQDFVAGFRFADTATRSVEPAELELSRVLRRGGLQPTLLAPTADLRANWVHGLPAKLRWFRDLAARQEAAPAIEPDAALTRRIAAYADTWLRGKIQNPEYGGRIRPGLLFWDTLLQHHHMPFLRRDLLVANPINDPSVLRLRDLLGAESLALLHRLIAPTLPDPSLLPHPPVLRLGLAAATPWTKVSCPAEDLAETAA